MKELNDNKSNKNTLLIWYQRIIQPSPLRVGVAHWVARLTRNVEVVDSSPIKCPVVSLINTHYPYCLVLVCSSNWFEREFTFELN